MDEGLVQFHLKVEMYTNRSPLKGTNIKHIRKLTFFSFVIFFFSSLHANFHS